MEKNIRKTKLYDDIEVALVDSMGSDLTVVNAARVSFATESSVFESRDHHLIRFLAEHDHWSPFAHCQVQFHIKAPIFVARQLVKHQIGLVWNEISRRYVDDDKYNVTFYMPKTWRERNPNAKQGSLDTAITSGHMVDDDVNQLLQTILKTYRELIKLRVCPEQARMILPLNTMTEWYWTGSLLAFARVCGLRLSKDAQKETAIVAEGISKHCEQLFPYSWYHLMAVRGVEPIIPVNYTSDILSSKITD